MELTKKLLQNFGLNCPVPDFSTVSRRGKQVGEVVRNISSPAGWYLLADDEGIQIMTAADAKNRNSVRNSRHEWIKLQVALEFR